jgi:hypothetical protein
MNCELIKSNVQFMAEIPQLPSSFFKSDFYKTNHTCYCLSKPHGVNGSDFLNQQNLRLHNHHQRASTILQSANKLEFMFNRIKNVLTKNKVIFILFKIVSIFKRNIY